MQLEMPQIPDDDADFTPDLTRKIIAQYQKIIADLSDPALKSMRLDDGSFNMALGGAAVERMARMMTTWFRESGAKNYVEISINALDHPFETYLFYVQKRGDGARTPAEIRQAVEAENQRLRSIIKDTIESIERNSTSAPVLERLKAALAD
ncbi:hypothetical protein ACRQ5Q_14400 [Bradyrhizobium sp. PMVTL-01]|uniref:hypothetical protein n=1 Tax=Bradyrhizobium sp. PMVTL-01 TaxID=3434999 RepID=UPI003F70AE97